MDPEEEAARAQARQNLKNVKGQIHELTMKLLTAEPAQLPAMTQRLQRLRVSMLMLREIVEDVADPNAHRELTLLQKMMAAESQVSPEDPDDQETKQREAEADARGRLAEMGVSPESAGQLVRVFQSLETLMRAQNESTPAGQPEPDADPAA